MPEQPQWPERTLDMPPQDPWADPPTTDMPPRAGRQGDSRTYDPTRQWGEPTATPPFQGSARPAPPQAPARPAPGRSPAAQPDRPASAPPGQPAGAPPNPSWSGRAAVNPRPQARQFATEHEPTGTGWPGAQAAPQERHPLEWHLRQLRRGGEWSFAGLLFAFVCWGIWALSAGGNLTTSVIVFIVSVLVAAGVFALSRLIGRVVLERQFGRERHTAKGSHIVAGIFLVGVGIAHLQQTEWVVTAWNWVAGLFSG
ncbi:hypothetical protein [Actinoplanes sp. N902-109]|uniref:hypothetical protein n=1 Tax=Actinoplanes sp. (strain N902-109) TaxID=649831 RepID=UPI0003293A3E|nr:hypothetical protein [Actinoplanes sp. N902-109]AGL14972.1 hypothetical protein L083_1462 [Actinoplanes sp. N902-109]